ncbi:hypothetical protein [Novosphingobium sp. FKTRR1]|nr:hypothetical protein [Novosphingobium sp. FKTRR1]
MPGDDRPFRRPALRPFGFIERNTQEKPGVGGGRHAYIRLAITKV